MNLDNPFLIKFLMILFSLEGSVSENVKIHSYIGHQIILPRPRSSARPHILIWTKDSMFIADCIANKITVSTKQPDKYHLFLNGTLKINRLKKMDAGNYTVKGHDEDGYKLFNELITLQVDASLKLDELCSQRILTCEVKSSEEPKPKFKLFQDSKEMFVQPVYDNGTWKVTLQLKVLSGKFRCEVDVNSGKNHTEKQITCPGEDLPDSVPIFLILIIMGSVVTLMIFLALIIYCIRRKNAKRHEREAEEYALQIQIENHMQQRKLPEIPVSSGCNPPSQKSRLPPSEQQQQVAPSKSCPHPKPPRRIKERP
ncbi:T-cell surface antigen CD2 [Pantherophis guttatus]|uniref:T-cell surface antigen CD2 n=1 Tax=Pantherophis guttatus TaxID=94885 RepID=A0ABM3Z1A6_PANGU|nr:T-cell surface antigen CD2 [Pantherophis guttatus]